VKTYRSLLAAALLILSAVPAVAQVNDTYVIPAAANARGGFGTHWMTRFTIFNPHLDRDLTVSVTWLPTGGAEGFEELIELPANSLAYSDNILDALYGVTNASGALLVAAFAEDNPGVPDTVFDRSFLVNSDTFNNHPSGTYGQGIAGEWIGLLDYESDAISSVSHGIRNSGVYRTNIGAVNLGACGVTLFVNAYDADGNTILSQAPFGIPPYGHMQDRLPIAVSNGSVEFFVSDPCSGDDEDYAVVFPYTSTIDQRTNDPSYQYPKLLASPSILYAKGKQIDTLNVGKKIDTTYARKVRGNMLRRGTAKLVRTSEGYEITK
jgi:hypothetical protein